MSPQGGDTTHAVGYCKRSQPHRSASLGPHLAVNVLLEFKLLLQGLQAVLGIHAAQHLILQLLLSLVQGTFQLGKGIEKDITEWAQPLAQQVPGSPQLEGLKGIPWVSWRQRCHCSPWPPVP